MKPAARSDVATAMGLGAYVHCRCFQDGLTTPPPVDARYDEEAGHVAPVRDTTLEELLEFDRWARAACPHPEMDAAHEHIGSWSACARFRHALHLVGERRVPTLTRELPTVNSGRTSAIDAVRILGELARFERTQIGWDRPVLVDGATGEALFERVEAYDGLFIWSEDVEAGLDADGRFFVREAGTNRVRFRSTDFTQHPLPRSASGSRSSPAVELRARDGQRLTLAEAIRGTGEPRHPRHLLVELRPVRTSTFAPIVSALRRIMRTAMELGMPVHWY